MVDPHRIGLIEMPTSCIGMHERALPVLGRCVRVNGIGVGTLKDRVRFHPEVIGRLRIGEGDGSGARDMRHDAVEHASPAPIRIESMLV